MIKLGILISISILNISTLAFAKQETKGILPELKIDSTDEDANQKKALQSEVLITKTENRAIQSLIEILKRKKGSPQEAELWYRLGELYMKRAKSGRFFDLNRDSDGPIKFVPQSISDESAIASLKRAVQVYTKIEREFPKFRDMDSVLFNNAFASHQLKLVKNAEALYYKMVTQHPKSSLVADAYLALGEMSYEQQDFKDAFDYFKAIEKFPEARVYAYGMYKGAWTLYNLHKSDEAIDKLIQVVQYNDPKNKNHSNHNLRQESLRDLTLFYGETRPAEEAVKFFSRIAKGEELGECIHNLGKLYYSHSRVKEMNLFLAQYIQKEPLSKVRIKLETLMVNGNEANRSRQESIKHLVAAAQLCKTGSDWRTMHVDIAELECDYDFAKTNVEMAKKWWELWQKNKNSSSAVEIAEYTKEAFRVHLDREDPNKPDAKSRYAFAELLFQLGEYRKASEQYSRSGATSGDTQIAHDATHSAIIALDKAMTQKKEDGDDLKLIQLSKLYLEKFPKGQYAIDIRYKLGFIAYEAEQFEESEKWLRPLTQETSSPDIQKKSEDLILDILNHRKDYKGIQQFSTEVAKNTKDQTRKTSLEKIRHEAEYSEIQETAKTSEKMVAAERLYKFYTDNKESPLAKDSLWQSLSLYYADGKILQGAEAAMVYAKKYPDDKRTLDALKDAAKNYVDSGLIIPAAETMLLISEKSPKDKEQYLEAASELYLVEGDIKKSQSTLHQLLTASPKEKQGKIIGKLLQSMKGQEKSPEYQKLQEQILSQNIQPYASEIKLENIEKIFASGKLSEAFNAAKPLVGNEGNIDDDIRAKARLIQAQVLEKEFTDTKTKTSVEKLAVVLSIKTEKLDKAQTAFLTAAKIAKDPNTKLAALQGLNRVYTNYVDSVGHPQLKDEATLTADDKKLLEEQLAKLTNPILEKKIDTDKQLQKLAKDFKAVRSQEIDYANLPAEETVKPRIENVPPGQLKLFLPEFTKEANFSEVRRLASEKSSKCEVPANFNELPLQTMTQTANQCVLSKNNEKTEKIALEMVKKDPTSPLGVFYLSLGAELQGKFEKSAWLIDLALKKSSELPFLLYQKGRALFQAEDYSQANAAFGKAYDKGLKTPETILFAGIVSFAQGDCYTTVDQFAQLDKETVQRLNLAPAISECQAQRGDFDKALSYAEEATKKSTKSAELWIQIGRIHEVYRFDSSKAQVAYETAAKTATGDMKDWLNRKLDFLKQKRPVSAVVKGD